MPTETELACPVCRAKQAYQAECRRCGADLSLFIKALRSLQATEQLLCQATEQDEVQRQHAMAYLRWLSPKAAQSF